MMKDYRYAHNFMAVGKLMTVDCIQWLKKDFLGYLDSWKRSVDERQKPQEENQGFSDSEKNKMQISQETLLGLRITSMF